MNVMPKMTSGETAARDREAEKMVFEEFKSATAGLQLVLLALGAAIQCFHWENAGSDTVDMTPGTAGPALSKAMPLVAQCSPRPDLIKLLSQI
ncbi:hypothetical protein V6N13_087175 [Hibiscus sabdariffa]